MWTSRLWVYYVVLCLLSLLDSYKHLVVAWLRNTGDISALNRIKQVKTSLDVRTGGKRPRRANGSSTGSGKSKRWRDTGGGLIHGSIVLSKDQHAPLHLLG